VGCGRIYAIYRATYYETHHGTEPLKWQGTEITRFKIGDMVCDCRYKHLKITEIDEDGDTLTLEDGSSCSATHCGVSLAPHDWYEDPPNAH
jgi:hypothetical protein